MSRVPQESARVVRINTLSGNMKDSRVRLAGRVILYEEKTQHLLLASRTKAIWVNVSLCIDPTESRSLSFVRESFSIITIFAYVQVSKERLPDFPLPGPRSLQEGGIHPHVYCEAFIARTADGLDLDDWERTIALRETTMSSNSDD